jgi:methionine--tRNA ligase beta chain
MNIPYSVFEQMELRIGRIAEAARVEGSDKLLKLSVDLGEKSADQPEFRQIIAGIGKAYEPDALIGRELLFIANLEPRTIMGLESQGMVLAATDDRGPVVMLPERPVPPGAPLK